MIFGFRADLDVERDAPEEAAFELEHEPVASWLERTGQLRDAPVTVGHTPGDYRAVLFDRDCDTRRRTAGRRIEDVR